MFPYAWLQAIFSFAVHTSGGLPLIFRGISVRFPWYVITVMRSVTTNPDSQVNRRSFYDRFFYAENASASAFAMAVFKSSCLICLAYRAAAASLRNSSAYISSTDAGSSSPGRYVWINSRQYHTKSSSRASSASSTTFLRQLLWTVPAWPAVSHQPIMPWLDTLQNRSSGILSAQYKCYPDRTL